ncbi:hypothetical protein KIN20_025731, partial [Parelaphostrongylus tenuis]
RTQSDPRLASYSSQHALPEMGTEPSEAYLQLWRDDPPLFTKFLRHGHPYPPLYDCSNKTIDEWYKTGSVQWPLGLYFLLTGVLLEKRLGPEQRREAPLQPPPFPQTLSITTIRILASHLWGLCTNGDQAQK